MDLAMARRLISPQGWSLVSSLPPYDVDAAMGLADRLREAGYDADLVAAALTQSRLRARARAKLGEFADGMLLTADGLEQATRWELAARHAQRFRLAGVRHVLDLTCGIGVDAMAMAALGLRVTAVDSDPVTAAAAGVNLRHFEGVRSLVARAQDVPLPTGAEADGAGVWVDPARRVPGSTDATGKTRRVFSLEGMSPPWSFLQEVAAAVPATGAKLSPSFPHSAVPAAAEAQWTSFGGEVLECALWWGPLARSPGRTATVIRPDGEHTVTEADTRGLGPVATGLPQPGDWLYEPDRAVLRAGLTGALTAATGGAELSHGVGYVVSSRPTTVGYAKRRLVTHAMPLQVKQVRAWLRGQGVGRLTIKTRGLPGDVEALRRQLRLDGEGEELTVILTRAGRTPAFIVVAAA